MLYEPNWETTADVSPKEAYPLHAYDAVHLATAAVANQRLIDSGIAPLTFLSADDRLNDVASAHG
jgi:predicted nucleic acid-binding protein